MPSLLKGKVRLGPDVVYRELGGEMVLLNLRTGVYFGLNQTGAEMWTLLLKLQEPAHVVAALEQEYAVGRSHLENDLGALLSTLREKRLVEVDEE